MSVPVDWRKAHASRRSHLSRKPNKVGRDAHAGSATRDDSYVTLKHTK